MTIIRENDDGENFETFAQLLGKLLDVAEMFYQLLSEDLRRKRQCAEEVRMHSEQTLYIEYDFGWEFQEEKR